MNQEHLHRLVVALYTVQDLPALDEYGSVIFERPVKGTWKLFRHIVKTAVADECWRWRPVMEFANYPNSVEVPTFEEFSTFMLHEATHGWCYFLKSEPSLWNYPIGSDEEEVCWDVSKLVCGILNITYHEDLANLSHGFYRYHLAHGDDVEGIRKIFERMPKHIQS